MNKIALCLSGYYHNEGNRHNMNKVGESDLNVKRDPSSDISYQYIKRKILDGNDVDVFIHSWDLNNQEYMLDIYNPVECVFEEQKTFKDELNEFDEDWFNEGFDRANSMYYANTIFRSLSYLYTRKQSVKLQAEYNKDYDCVVMARFDLGTRGLKAPVPEHVTNINFFPDVDMSRFYSAYWNQLNWGYGDHWFYSNPKNMEICASLYDCLFDYLQPDSEYVNAVCGGWPDSNLYEEFSVEVMKPLYEKTSSLMKWPKDQCIDNHKLYKWHFIKTGLYQKNSFINIKDAYYWSVDNG
jgi:hypothetical protein